MTRLNRHISVLLMASASVGLVACHQRDGASPTNPPTSAPAAECSTALAASIGCDAYRSIGATETGIDLDWVGDATLELEAIFANDTPTLIVTTPCNVLNVPVEIDGAVLHPGSITSTSAGCDPDRTAQQRWVQDFLSTDVRWEKTNRNLALHTENATVEFTVD